MNQITIICEPLIWYSHNDEEFVFTWFKRIDAIKKVKGIGEQLFLYFDSTNISDQELIELMGIFERYNFKNKEQLELFKTDQNAFLFEEDEDEW